MERSQKGEKNMHNGQAYDAQETIWWPTDPRSCLKYRFAHPNGPLARLRPIRSGKMMREQRLAASKHLTGINEEEKHFLQ